MAAHLRIFSCGSNAKGQLSNSNTEDSYTFEPCHFSVTSTVSNAPHGVQRIHKIVAGGNHTLILVDYKGSDGVTQPRLYGCGDASQGQLGRDMIELSNVTRFNRINFESFEKQGFVIADVAASWETTYVVLRPSSSHDNVTKSDILLSMGSNDFGDLGVTSGNGMSVIGASSGKGKGKSPNLTSPESIATIVPFSHLVDSPYQITHVATGTHHVVAVLKSIRSAFVQDSSEQLIVGWGACRHGQLGHIPLSTSSKTRTTTACLKTMYPPFIPTPTVLTIPTLESRQVVSVAAGSQHTVLLTSDGTLLSLGSNRKSQIEGLDSLESISQIGCSWNSTYALISGRDNDALDPYIVSTGSGERGQLGIGASSSSSSTSSGRQNMSPQPFTGGGRIAFPAGGNNVASLACGSEHVLVVRKNKLLLDNTETQGSEIWGWGWNEHGNLGLGHNQDVHIPTRIWPNNNMEHELDDGLKWEAVGAWAGCGTSWLVFEATGPEV